MFTREIKVKVGQSTLITLIIKRKRCRIWREINIFPSISSLTDSVFSIFRQKKVRLRSLGNGHQSGFSRADTINKNKKQKIKDNSIQGINTIIQLKNILKNGKIKFIVQKDSILHAASIKTTGLNKLGVYPSPFHVSTSSGLTLPGAFRGGYVAACSTAFRSAAE